MEVMLVVRALILHPTEPRLLLVQRSGQDRHNPDCWEPPGGKVDSGETPDQAIVREVWEEVSLEVCAISPMLVGPSRIMADDDRYAGGGLYLPLYMVFRATDQTVTLSIEHQQGCWWLLAEVDGLALSDLTKTALQLVRPWLA